MTHALHDSWFNVWSMGRDHLYLLNSPFWSLVATPFSSFLPLLTPLLSSLLLKGRKRPRTRTASCVNRLTTSKQGINNNRNPRTARKPQALSDKKMSSFFTKLRPSGRAWHIAMWSQSAVAVIYQPGAIPFLPYIHKLWHLRFWTGRGPYIKLNPAGLLAKLFPLVHSSPPG